MNEAHGIKDTAALSDHVSAVMVSFRTGPFLFRALDALFAQPEIRQIIVVDNGNPADVQAKLMRDERIQLITGHGNIGYAAGCNLGVKAVEHEILLLVNPDCELRSGAVANLQAAAGKFTRPWLLGCLIRDLDGQEQRACRRNLLTPETMLVEGMRLDLVSKSRWGNKRLNITTPLPKESVSVPAVSGALIFMPTADYRAIDGMDDGFFLHVEDLDFFRRFRLGGGQIFFTPNAVANHLKGSSDISSAWVEWQKSKGFMRYFAKHYSDSLSLFQRAGINLLVILRFLMKSAIGVVNRPAARRQQ